MSEIQREQTQRQSLATATLNHAEQIIRFLINKTELVVLLYAIAALIYFFADQRKSFDLIDTAIFAGQLPFVGLLGYFLSHSRSRTD